MRLIFVKPTNATRRLDSTGEVFHDGDHEHCASGGPSPLTKSSEGMCDRFSGTSVEASSSLQEASLCCVSPSPHKRSNGVNQPRSSAEVSSLKTRNVTLSQLGDEDWLLLCGQVSSDGDDTPSAERAGTSMAQPNHSARCGCACPDAYQHSDASSFHVQSKQSTAQDFLSGVSNKKSSESSPHELRFSAPTTCQVLPQQNNQKDLLKPATNHPQDNFMLQRSDQDGRKEQLKQQPCNHFTLKNSKEATLFNIPLNSVECAETNQKLHQHPQPPVTADLSWRELFGKEPLLVQQRQTQDSQCSASGDQTFKSSIDASIVLKCRHLPCNPLISTARMKRSSTPASNHSVQSFSTSHYSSLENQELMGERQRRSHVREFSLNPVTS